MLHSNVKSVCLVIYFSRRSFVVSSVFQIGVIILCLFKSENLLGQTWLFMLQIIRLALNSYIIILPISRYLRVYLAAAAVTQKWL